MAARAAARTNSLRRNAELRRLADRGEVRARLNAARAFTAYARAYLDPRMYDLAEFYEARYGEKSALLMHARGGLGPSSLALGEPEAVSALLRLHPGPLHTFLTCEPQHIEVVLASHNLWRPQTMLRMQVDRASFVTPPPHLAVRRLGRTDADQLNRLYAIEGDGLRYSGRQVTQGVYFGGFVRDRLVSAAGTHIHSLAEGVGVIGNVFTHPDHRGHGLGTAVTAAVARHLLTACDLVVLNVDPANRVARHVYESLGFREAGRLLEAMATRRDGSLPLPFLRRILARWRSGKRGVELVSLA